MEISMQSIEATARSMGVSDVAIKAWRTSKGTHDFMPWEYDNVTGELHRGPGVSGDPKHSPRKPKKRT